MPRSRDLQSRDSPMRLLIFVSIQPISLGGGAVGEILSSVNESLGGSHSVVVRARGDWTQSGLTLRTSTSAPTPTLRCMTAGSGVGGLDGLDDPA